ncbi:MAG: hypothetical protein LBV68_05120, partial [Spirochaetaceae bacterium]|nr:hypothetical protein [Spirochaetaceae bacterium]
MKNILPKVLFFTFFLCMLTFFSYAANVSFMVIEVGSGTSGLKRTYEVWEDGILEVFFNAGHIISNAQVQKIPFYPNAELPEEAVRDFREAGEGGSEYFI